MNFMQLQLAKQIQTTIIVLLGLITQFQYWTNQSLRRFPIIQLRQPNWESTAQSAAPFSFQLLLAHYFLIASL